VYIQDIIVYFELNSYH